MNAMALCAYFVVVLAAIVTNVAAEVDNRPTTVIFVAPTKNSVMFLSREVHGIVKLNFTHLAGGPQDPLTIVTYRKRHWFSGGVEVSRSEISSKEIENLKQMPNVISTAKNSIAWIYGGKESSKKPHDEFGNIGKFDYFGAELTDGFYYLQVVKQRQPKPKLTATYEDVAEVPLDRDIGDDDAKNSKHKMIIDNYILAKSDTFEIFRGGVPRGIAGSSYDVIDDIGIYDGVLTVNHLYGSPARYVTCRVKEWKSRETKITKRFWLGGEQVRIDVGPLGCDEMYYMECTIRPKRFLKLYPVMIYRSSELFTAGKCGIEIRTNKLKAVKQLPTEPATPEAEGATKAAVQQKELFNGLGYPLL